MRAWPSILLFASTAHASAPVVGGTPVPAGTWPDAVAVIGPQGSCTGTLIAPDVVLTAGHCAEIHPSQIIANTTDYTAQGGTNVNVASTTSYPGWQTAYDVSVIVLANAVPGVTPRAVGTACTFGGFSTSSHVHLVGFGLTDTAGLGDNTVLHEAMATVTDPDCTQGNGCQAAVAPGGEFVAGGGGTDSCFGDSGGPVYLDTPRGPVVIAAVSRGVTGAATACGGGGIYVRTDKIVTWLEQTSGRTIAKDGCATPPPGGGSGREPGLDDRDVVGGCAAAGGHGGWLAALALALVTTSCSRSRRRTRS